jgi:hypothetical protein
MRAKATRSTAVSVPECPRTTRRKLIIPRDRAAAEMFLAHPISRPLLASDRVPLHQVVQLARLHLLRAEALLTFRSLDWWLVVYSFERDLLSRHDVPVSELSDLVDPKSATRES